MASNARGMKRKPRRKARPVRRTPSRPAKGPLNRQGVFLEEQFDERLQLEMRRAERYFVFLSLMVMQVDCLDWRGGRWQWRAKRDFLPDVATILKNNTRDVDTLFRFDGEKFAFILPETNDEGSFEAAQRLRRLVEGAKLTRLTPLSKLRVSFGLSSFPSDARNKLQLLKNARRSLAEAVRQNQRRLPEAARPQRSR